MKTLKKIEVRMRMCQAVYNHVDQKWSDLPDENEWNLENVLVLAFCSPNLYDNPEIFKKISEVYSKCTVVGCSTAGEIHDEHVLDNSISLTFIHLEQSSFKFCKKPLNQIEMSNSVSQEIARELIADDLKGVLILSEGLAANGSEVAKGFNEILPPGTPIGGGLAGDSTNFKSTYIVHNGEVVKNHLGAVGFYGESLEIHTGSKGGWDIFGPERTITKSQGSLLYEIDGKPALDLYKEYLGDKASELPASGLLFPLQVNPPDREDKKLVRTILNIDEENKALIFAGDVPEGWTGQLMRANFEKIIDASGSVYEKLTSNFEKDQSQLVVAVSCVGRRLVLGERCEEEVESIKTLLPEGSKIAGFYSYGEISPISEGKPCELHNQTMTLFVLNEKEAGKASSAA